MCGSGVLEKSELHEVVIKRLRKQSNKDFVTGEYFISNSDCRKTLGVIMHIDYEYHVTILRELKELGLIERISQNIIKIKGE